MNATYQNIMGRGAQVFGTDLSKKKLEEKIANSAELPVRSLRNFKRHEPPVNHPYLTAIATTLETSTDTLTAGSENKSPVTFYHQPRHPRFKYSGMRKAIGKYMDSTGMTLTTISAETGLAVSIVKEMNQKEISNQPNAMIMFSFLGVSPDSFTPKPLTTRGKKMLSRAGISSSSPVHTTKNAPAEPNGKLPRMTRKKYWGLRKLIQQVKEDNNLKHSELAVVTGIHPTALSLMENKQIANVENLGKLLTMMGLPLNYLDAKVRANRNGKKSVVGQPLVQVSRMPSIKSPEVTAIDFEIEMLPDAADRILMNFVMTINESHITGKQTMTMLTDDAEMIAHQALIARGLKPEIFLNGRSIVKAFLG